MTTHETPPAETLAPTEAPLEAREAPLEAREAPLEAERPPVGEPLVAEQPTPVSEPIETGAPTGDLDPQRESVDSTTSPDSSDQVLFADGELSGLRSRWTEVQSAFVDDPRDCVQKADGLVSDVVDKLTAGFSSARAHLEEQWDRGEQVSTEDLRIALKRYREFFERLLAV